MRCIFNSEFCNTIEFSLAPANVIKYKSIYPMAENGLARSYHISSMKTGICWRWSSDHDNRLQYRKQNIKIILV